MKKIIDLRSDTVTKPCDGMRKAMYNAEVGDDVYGEDPTVNRLEGFAADLLGKEAALFVPSGVMGNQICLNVLTNPGDEVLCDVNAHIIHYESGSAAAISGIQLTPVQGKNGILDAEMLIPHIRPVEAYYMPRTKVIEIENTNNRAGGTITPLENISGIASLAKKHNLYMHLDGARIWNASVKTGISVSKYASYFDTVSCCLSKGLGAPIGSIIAGDKDFIKEAFRVRKAWGGGMRQVGIIAAAGLFALQNNFERLKEDNDKASYLANELAKFESVELNPETVHTNIIIFKPLKSKPEEIISKCSEKGLLISDGGFGKLRIVTHKDVSSEDVTSALNILKEIFE